MKTQHVFSVLIAIFLVSTSFATTITVNPGESIQTALNNAIDNDVIIVQPGTYRELITMPSTLVTLQSSAPTNPAVVATTIINGDIDSNGTGDGIVISCGNSMNDDSVISGFTITNGNGTAENTYGGGMCIYKCSPTVSYCVFSNNLGNWGGGIWIAYDCSPTITNCTFEGNEAVRTGGGIYTKENAGYHPVITECIFQNNTAVELGGGLYSADTTLTLTDSTFCSNLPDTVSGYLADDSGDNVIYTDCENSIALTKLTVGKNAPRDFSVVETAIHFADDGYTITVKPGTYVENINMRGKAVTLQSIDPTDPNIIVRTILDGNAAGSVITCDSGEGADTVINGFVITNGSADDGGGMYTDHASLTIRNCTFSDNTADSSGGGMYNYYASPTISNCTFSNNTVEDSSGGGMYNYHCSPIISNCMFSHNSAYIDGGGMFNYYASPTISNCTFFGNTVRFRGGGMSNSSSSPTVSHCTFSANEVILYSGGGMENYNSSPMVSDCTFRDNAVGESGGGIYSGSNGYSSCVVTVSNCTFSGNTAEDSGGGIYNNDDGLSQQTLTDSFFCVNTPDAIVGPYVDVSGNNFSYCPPPRLPFMRIPGDIDASGKVDLEDFSIIANQMRALTIIAENWLEGVD